MNVLKNYFSQILNFDFVSKCTQISYAKQLPKIKKCTVQVSLKLSNENSLLISDSFLFMEWLTCQRPLLKKAGFLYKNYKPLIHVVLSVTLRNFFLDNLFNYILICTKLNPQKSIYIKAAHNEKLNTFYLTVSDVNFFFNIPEFLYKFNEPIIFIFELSDSDIDSRLFWSSFPSIFYNTYIKKNKTNSQWNI